MTLRNTVLCSTFAIAAAMSPILGSARTIVDIDIAPPAPREEVVPAPRHGYVWAPGYWSWAGKEHVWVAGHYIRERPGHHWIAEHWEQRGPHWHFEPGHWD